jgi:hypothetical protein
VEWLGGGLVLLVCGKMIEEFFWMGMGFVWRSPGFSSLLSMPRSSIHGGVEVKRDAPLARAASASPTTPASADPPSCPSYWLLALKLTLSSSKSPHPDSSLFVRASNPSMGSG